MKNLCDRMLDTMQRSALIIALLCLGLSAPVYAQTGDENAATQTPADSTAVPAEEATSEKAELRMGLETFKINEQQKLVARVRSKVKAKFQNIPGVEISFYKDEVLPENLIGKDTSDHKGEAIWMLSPAPATSSTYWAVVQNHPVYADAQETITTLLSKVDMKLEEEDTLRMVKITVSQPDEAGQLVPMPDVDVTVYVKRLFGNLPIGDAETTDADGNISVEFPKEIQGDESGTITVVAKIAENESLGNVEVSQAAAWGIPSKVDDFYLQRELWSARANSPLILIFVVNAVLIGIWGVIAFIFLEIYRINRLGKAN